MERKKKEKTKSTLTTMQEVTYAREFRRADRAAGVNVGKRGGNQ